MKRISLILLCIFLAAAMLYACSAQGAAAPALEDWTLPDTKGGRDNTPLCLVPSADGREVLANDAVTVDVSNADQGYVIVSYTGDSAKVKLQITGGDGATYTFSPRTDGVPEVFPLCAGDGAYLIGVYENIQQNEYAVAFSEEIDVHLASEYLPYLYPNQYVSFTADSLSTAKAKELARPADTDLDVISNVYNYVIRNVSYDHEEAETVQSGYLPDVDEVLTTGQGICLDYSALMTAMLRSQQIPTRMEVGYAGTAYHAWLSTYIEDVGWVNGVIEFDGESWKLMDPTLASNQGDKSLQSFIGDGSNYNLKYMY